MNNEQLPRYARDLGEPPDSLQLEENFPDPPRRKPISEERYELLRDAGVLAYDAIRFAGLHRQLTSAEWDALAERLAARALMAIDIGIAEEFTALEAKNVLSGDCGAAMTTLNSSEQRD